MKHNRGKCLKIFINEYAIYSINFKTYHHQFNNHLIGNWWFWNDLVSNWTALQVLHSLQVLFRTLPSNTRRIWHFYSSWSKYIRNIFIFHLFEFFPWNSFWLYAPSCSFDKPFCNFSVLAFCQCVKHGLYNFLRSCFKNSVLNMNTLNY